MRETTESTANAAVSVITVPSGHLTRAAIAWRPGWSEVVSAAKRKWCGMVRSGVVTLWAL